MSIVQMRDSDGAHPDHEKDDRDERLMEAIELADRIAVMEKGQSQNWSAVLVATVRPTLRFDREFLTVVVAILGTTISPYLFFWQVDQEVEEEISMRRPTN